MRITALALLLIASTGALAQSSDSVHRFLPGPAAVVLELGRWIIQGREEVRQVTVQGVGRDQAEAHDQALRLAVSQALGTTVFTEVRVDLAEKELKSVDQVNHSGGVVDRFEILKTGQDALGRFTLDMHVWVRRSRLADGQFGARTNTTAIQGPQIAATVASESQQRRTSGPLVEAGLRGFPERAFQIKVKRHEWQMSGRDFAHLLVDLTLEWDKDWFARFYWALEDANGIDKKHGCYYDLRQCRSSSYMYVIMWLRPNGAKTVAAWTDSVNYRAVESALMTHPLSLRVSLMGAGRRLHSECFSSSRVSSDYAMNQWFNVLSYDGAERRFYWDPPHQGLQVFSWARQPLSLRVPGLNVDLIKGVDNLEIQVVKTPDCR